MNPLPGFELIPDGRLHVVGARHPLERLARLFLVRAATGALVLHATLFVALFLAQLRAQRVIEDGGAVAPALQPIVILPPPSLDPGSQGEDLDGLAAGRAATPTRAGIPDPVLDFLAVQPTVPDMWEIDLPVDAEAGDEIFRGRGGHGGAWDSLDTRVFARALPPDEDGALNPERLPVLVSMREPSYPSLARDAGVQGEVVIRALVGEDGRVRKAIVARGPAILGDAAAEAVRDALFRPGLQGDRPVRCWVLVPVRFSLE